MPGPTQCGKTTAASWGFFRWASLRFAGFNFALCSRSAQQFNRALLPHLKSFAYEHALTLRRSEDNAWEMQPFIEGGPPNTFYRQLGNNSGSADKAMGPPAAGALFDEWPLMPPDFLKATESRCSITGAKLVYTGNPQGRTHFAKTDYVDRCADPSFHGLHVPFQLHDRPGIDPEYIRSLHEIYSGAMARRMIYGEWATTEGVIYEDADQHVRRPPPLDQAFRFELSADDAMAKVTHALLMAQFNEGWWVLDEWRHDGRETGKIDPFFKARSILRKFQAVAGSRGISWFVGDPAAQNLRAALEIEWHKRTGERIRVAEGENEILPGIQLTDMWLRMGKVKIAPRCSELIRQLHGYTWDERAALRGEDRPDPTTEHDGCDALRYWCYTRAGLPRRGGPILVSKGGPPEPELLGARGRIGT